jgi:hypothetical protein
MSPMFQTVADPLLGPAPALFSERQSKYFNSLTLIARPPAAPHARGAERQEDRYRPADLLRKQEVDTPARFGLT